MKAPGFAFIALIAFTGDALADDPAGAPAVVAIVPPAENPSPLQTMPADLPTTAEIRAADELGRLNAAMQAHAAALGIITTYEREMRSALAIADPNDQAAAIIAARSELASTAQVTLTALEIGQIDSDLGISGVSPLLGTEP